MQRFIHAHTSGALPNLSRACGSLGAQILPGKEERGASPAPDHRSTGADASTTQGTCLDTLRAVPGPALLTWSTISPNPNPSPCPGTLCVVCPIPTPRQDLWVPSTLPSLRTWAGKSCRGAAFGGGRGAGGGSGVLGAAGARVQAGAAGHCQVTSAGARKSDSRCIRSAVLQFQFHRLTIIFRLLLVPH